MDNFKDGIILTGASTKSYYSKKGKFVVDRTMIKGIFCTGEGDNKEVTRIRIPVEYADSSGLHMYCDGHVHREQKYIDIAVEEEIKVVLGLVRGDKAMEILHGK